MPLLSIRERPGGPDGSNATVSIDNAGEYPIAIVPPFDGEEEARLNWYFEEHLSFPFTEQVDIVRPGSYQELASRLHRRG